MRKILTLIGLVIGLLAMLAVPASAHSSVLSGQTTCVNGTHVVTWTIGNDFGLTMEITPTATLGNQTFPVVGFTSPVGVSPATTTATTTLPGNLTGNVTLTVVSVWTDEFTQTNSTSVALTVPCVEDTTTTTVAPTTTTISSPVSSTTLPPPVTTTSSDVRPTTTTLPPPDVTTSTGDTTTTTGPPLTTTTNICTVPPVTMTPTGPCWRSPGTGFDSGPLALGGVTALGVGGLLAGAARKRRRI